MPGQAFIRGDSIDLRTIEEADREFLRRGSNHPDVRRYISVFRRPSGEGEFDDEFERFYQGEDDVNLLVCDGEERVGSVSLAPVFQDRDRANLGIWVHPDAQGNGYATAATRLVVEYAFDELGLHSVSAVAMAPNEASRRMLERVGFVEEGRRREAAFVGGEYVDEVEYGLLAREWSE